MRSVRHSLDSRLRGNDGPGRVAKGRGFACGWPEEVVRKGATVHQNGGSPALVLREMGALPGPFLALSGHFTG